MIGGGYALYIYKLYLSDMQLANNPIGTRDIDSLLPRRVPAISKKNIARHLCDAGFTNLFKDLDIPATESYVKEIDGSEVEIEFLTDISTRQDKSKNVNIAGVIAQPLSYLSLSIDTTTEFETYTKERGRVVSPGAWIFHKALTFVKRKIASKKAKDLYGIWYVTSQLGFFSETAIKEFATLCRKHTKWAKTAEDNLLVWMDQATSTDWSVLESQETSGSLKKLNFIRTIQSLIKALRGSV